MYIQFSEAYSMFPADESGSSEGRSGAENATVRSTYIIGPDRKVKLIMTYPMTTGRKFHEILRVIDSIQLTAEHQVGTPANWNDGRGIIMLQLYPMRKLRKRVY